MACNINAHFTQIRFQIDHTRENEPTKKGATQNQKATHTHKHIQLTYNKNNSKKIFVKKYHRVIACKTNRISIKYVMYHSVYLREWIRDASMMHTMSV